MKSVDTDLDNSRVNENVQSVESTENAVQYAGFWARFFATVLDQLIWSLLVVAIFLSIYGMAYFANQQEGNVLLDYFVNYGMPAIVTIVFWKYKSATPGKMLMGMSVVDADTGGQPSTGRLILRYFAYIISALPLLIGYFWVAFDKRKQSFHDKIANTVVVMNAAPVEFQGSKSGAEIDTD